MLGMKQTSFYGEVDSKTYGLLVSDSCKRPVDWQSTKRVSVPLYFLFIFILNLTNSIFKIKTEKQIPPKNQSKTDFLVQF